MSEKRFELLDETIFDNQKQAEDGGRVTYWVVEYQQRQELVELLNSQNREINTLKQRINILREEIQSTSYILKMQTRKLEGLKMTDKRFECVFVEDEEFGGTYRRLKDNETGIMHMTCDVADLLNFQNTQIKILKEENEHLRKKLEQIYGFKGLNCRCVR